MMYRRGVHFDANISRHGGKTSLVTFPDLPELGQLSLTSSLGAIVDDVTAALGAFLVLALEERRAVPRPTPQEAQPGATLLPVWVAPSVAVALQLRWARTDREWSQAHLAKVVGVPQQQIARLEMPHGNPTVETISKVARALGLDVGVTLEKRPTYFAAFGEEPKFVDASDHLAAIAGVFEKHKVDMSADQIRKMTGALISAFASRGPAPPPSAKHPLRKRGGPNRG